MLRQELVSPTASQERNSIFMDARVIASEFSTSAHLQGIR